MSNKLKSFIWNNRKAFDSEVPSGKVWQHVEASFSEPLKKRSMLRPIYKWVMPAPAILIIALVYFLTPKKNETILTDSGNSKLPQEMVQFVKMIDKKQEELKTIAKEQPELYQQFTSAITQLDSSYNTLKNQLGSTPNEEMLLEAMIQNLQLQLNVLNQQLNIIHQIKQKKYSHEKNDQPI